MFYPKNVARKGLRPRYMDVMVLSHGWEIITHPLSNGVDL